MGSIYSKRGVYYLRIKAKDRWIAKSSKIPVGETEQERTRNQQRANRMLERLEARVEAEKGVLGSSFSGPLTVRVFAAPWVQERKALGIVTWKDNESRLRDHVLPVIGDMEISKVRPRHLADLVKNLRIKGEIAPKTVINIYSTIRALFRDALIADLIEQTPAILTRHQLGELHDKDPAWRRSAVFSRDEMEMLLADPRIDVDRVVVYALAGLAGLRHGEIAGLRWHRYDAGIEPLGSLSIVTSYDTGRTKTGDGRLVPVHPTLAAILAEWRLGGWAAMMGRPPESDDLIVPLPFDEARKQARPNPRGGRMRDKNDSWKRWKSDLATLGLRHRRLHDLRATFVTLTLDDGAEPHVLERVTHVPKRGASAFGGYSRPQWETVCREVAKLRVVRRRRGDLIALPRLAVGGGTATTAGGSEQDDEIPATGSDDEGFVTLLPTLSAATGRNRHPHPARLVGAAMILPPSVSRQVETGPDVSQTHAFDSRRLHYLSACFSCDFCRW